jgi:hypothetical protein
MSGQQKGNEVIIAVLLEITAIITTIIISN